jgi:K+-sensing histidine kinase KdpD
VGLPASFDLESTGLGLSIVRTLVESELEGSLRIGVRPEGGTCVRLDLPVR